MRLLLVLLVAAPVLAAGRPAAKPAATKPGPAKPAATKAAPARRADVYADGWTPASVGEAIGACGDALVQGAWRNTLREQHMPEDQVMTAEMRARLAPQIAGLRKVCDCTVRKTAARYGKHEWDTQRDAMDRYAVELVQKGTCPLPK